MIPRFTPGQLNKLARQLLEDTFSLIEVEGEIGTFKPAASGHWYFVIKDANAELRAVMYRSRTALVKFRPEAGAQVLVRGRITLFEARGEYQLLAEWLEPAGLGAQLLALRRMREQLASEGLFAAERKRALPLRPRRIALMTSAQGAALHDVLSVLQRRFPLLAVEFWPIPVQGSGAAAEVVASLRVLFSALPLPDALLITRGGGSKEDLQLFDDEALARVLASAPMPTVAAIGHEIDLTTIELVADLRAATPSAAAELLVPDRVQLARHLLQLQRRAMELAQSLIYNLQQRIDHQTQRLEREHPRRRIQLAHEQLTRLQANLQRGFALALETRRAHLQRAQRRLLVYDPRLRLSRTEQALMQLDTRLRQSLSSGLQARAQRLRTLTQSLQAGIDWSASARRLQQLRERLQRAWQAQHQAQENQLDLLRRSLHLTSPQATLERGYALVFGRTDARVRASAAEILPHEALRIAFHDGDVAARAEGQAKPA